MKEKCEKYFHILELIIAVSLVLFILITTAILVLWVIFLITNHKYILIIPVSVFVIFCDIINIVDFKIYKKSAYFIERNGEDLIFYVVGGTITKKISDCTKINNFAYYRILFMFNDKEKIRLRKFIGCPEATNWISKNEFPNAK